MTRERDVILSLLSWLGQTTPRDYVRWLRKTQPDVFGGFSEDDATRKLEAVMSAAWSAVADTAERSSEPREEQ